MGTIIRRALKVSSYFHDYLVDIPPLSKLATHSATVLFGRICLRRHALAHVTCRWLHWVVKGSAGADPRMQSVVGSMEKNTLNAIINLVTKWLQTQGRGLLRLKWDGNGLSLLSSLRGKFQKTRSAQKPPLYQQTRCKNHIVTFYLEAAKMFAAAAAT